MLKAAHILALGLWVFVAPVGAASDSFEQAALIDGLARQGMSDLLDHFAETEAMEDEVLLKQIELARWRIAYAHTEDAHQREVLHGELLSALRGLIAAYPEHALQLVWRVDLAELLLLDGLAAMHQQAVLFLAFGVATGEQRAAAREAAGEAVGLWEEGGFAKPQAAEKAAADTPGARFGREYVEVRWPYLRALAVYIKAAEDGEKTEELRAALRNLETVIETSESQDLLRGARLLAGQIRLRLGESEAALGDFDAVIETGREDVTDLAARVGRLWPLWKRGLFDPSNRAGADTLDALFHHKQARTNLLMRLLITDAYHRIAGTYAPYRRLLIDSGQGVRLESFLAARWGEELPADVDAEKLPAWVAAAAGRSLRQNGSRLDLAIRLLTRVANDEQAESSLRVQTMYELGWATLQHEPDRATGALAASAHWLRLAELWPDQSEAGRAVRDAADQLLPHLRDATHGGEIVAAYRRAATLLVTKYPDAAATGGNGGNHQRVLLELSQQADIDPQSLSPAEAGAAAKQARAVLDDAGARGETETELLPLRLRYIELLRLSGDARQAAALLEPVLQSNPNDADVIRQAGETFFALGGRDHLNQAAAHFNRIIISYEQPPYPPMFWNAWLRRLQIMILLNDHARDVPLRVRQLRQLDPELGGDRYRAAFEALEKPAASH